MSNPLPAKRGLGALLQKTSGGVPNFSSPNTPPSLLPLTALRPNPNQPRKDFKEDALQELTDSIKAKGVLQPIIVRPLQASEIQGDAKYEIVAGERRFRASQRAGLKEVPVHIKNVTEAAEILVLSLIENIQRNDLNPLEECRAYHYLKSVHHITQDEIAQATGKSRASIANAMRLQDLPAGVQDMVASGTLSFGHAKLLAAIPDNAQVTSIASKASAEGWSVRDLENYLASPENNSPKLPLKSDKPSASSLDPDVESMLDVLREHFGTKVQITQNSKKGKILIEFYSVEDFNQIMNRMGVKRSS